MSDIKKELASIDAAFERLPGFSAMSGHPVPGVGPILAAFCFAGELYAVRTSGGAPTMYRLVGGTWERQ